MLMIRQIRKPSWTSRIPGFVLCLISPALGYEHAAAQCTPVETAQIMASDGAVGDFFGGAVSISGHLLAVGARLDDDLGLNSGSVYLFEKNVGLSTGWVEAAKLHAMDGIAGHKFGHAVSVSGDTIVIGVPADSYLALEAGAAYVFERDQNGVNGWKQIAKLYASDGSDSDSFGLSVAVSGDTCVIGAYFADNLGLITGSAYVFSRDHGGINAWGEVCELVGSDAKLGDRFGSSVAISGSTIVVGAPGHDGQGPEAGAAYVFQRPPGVSGGWVESAILSASDGKGGNQFGTVAVSEDIAVVGAQSDNPHGQSSGSAYVFERDNGGSNNWGQVAKLVPSDGAVGDEFGTHAAVSETTVVVRATFDDDNGLSSGSVYVFERDFGGNRHWGQVTKLLPSDGAPQDFFGQPSISQELIIVGASKGLVPGAAYEFQYRPQYEPVTYCTAKPSSLPGCVPGIQANGVASASSLAGFVLSCGALPDQSIGVFLYTHDGAASAAYGPFGALCIPPRILFRTGLLQATGVTGVCDGILSFDWNAYAQFAIFYDPASTQPGTTVDGQFWYRDPPNSGGANLTDAVGFLICR